MIEENLLIIGGVVNLETILDLKTDRGFVEKYTDWYFMPKAFERNGKFYEYIGIKQFKKLVMNTAGLLLRMNDDNKKTLSKYVFYWK